MASRDASDVDGDISPNTRFPSILYLARPAAKRDRGDRVHSDPEDEPHQKRVRSTTDPEPSPELPSPSHLLRRRAPTAAERAARREKRHARKASVLRARLAAEKDANNRFVHKVTSWAHWREWVLLKNLLTANEHRLAVKLLTALQLRRSSAIPLPVSMSVHLVRLLNFDDAPTSPSPSPSSSSSSSAEQQRRLSLALLIIRFINGLTADSNQFRKMYDPRLAQLNSVSNRANRIQLPYALVELRHQATHGSLPSLSIVTNAAKQALVWLDIHYWQPQYASLEQCAALPVEETVGKLKTIFEQCAPMPPRSINDDMLKNEREKLEKTVVSGKSKEKDEENGSDIMSDSDGGEKEKEAEKEKEKPHESAEDNGETVLNLLKKCIQDLQGDVKENNDKESKQTTQKNSACIDTDKQPDEQDKQTEKTIEIDDDPRVHVPIIPCPTQGIWEECGDQHLWKQLPVGVIPGQTEAPCLTRDDLTGPDDMSGSEIGHSETSLEKDDEDDE